MLITLAAEDDLSIAVAKRLVGEYAPAAEIVDLRVAGGSIKSLIPSLNQIARHIMPVLAFADLDRPQSCAPDLVRELSNGLTISPDMIIRIAVMEIEAWIMADREGFAKWLSIAASIVSRDPESLNDPKRTLVNLAARSRKRALREGIAPDYVRGTHRTGASYNILLDEFVTQHWNPEAARANAPSLARTIARIAQLAAP